MAKRRMFSPDIVSSDAFVDMPHSSQSLYFHLCMAADDDGFVGKPKQVCRMVNVNEDDLKILLAKRFLLGFPSGVVVIKHWLVNNFIRQDRYKKTTYTKERETLTFNEFGAYTELSKIHENVEAIVEEVTTKEDVLTDADNQSATNGIPTSIPLVDPGKVRLGKVRYVDTKVSTIGEKDFCEFVSKSYYDVIRLYDLPVLNHNVIRSKIRDMSKTRDEDLMRGYFNLLLNGYQELEFDKKPELLQALDVFSKRQSIISAIKRQGVWGANGKPRVGVIV